jgi:ABC-2 type transport system ATP-binding protein
MTDQTAFIEVNHLDFSHTVSKQRFYFLNGVKKTYPVLRDVNFQLPQGGHMTLFGKEAAGKTTLLNLLSGELSPSNGHVLINGKKPKLIKHAYAGYVSDSRNGNEKNTGYDILHGHAKTQRISDPAARVDSIADLLELSQFLHRSSGKLSATQQIRLNLAQAAICDTPLVLLDDVTDRFSAKYINKLLHSLFSGRTVIVATRSARAADSLGLSVLLLHEGTLIHQGTIDKIALDASCPRIVDVWIEGLRYDILRKLRKHNGVMEARLVPSDQFAGQRLRITLRSARYLPTMYDLISQATLVQVSEIPPSLNEVVNRLDSVTVK